MSPYDDPAVSAGEIADYLRSLTQKLPRPAANANAAITPAINSKAEKPMTAFSLPSGSAENNFQPDQISNTVGDPNTIASTRVGTRISITQK